MRQWEDERTYSHHQDAGGDDARLALSCPVVADQKDGEEGDEVVGGGDEPWAAGRELEAGFQRRDDSVDDAVDDEALQQAEQGRPQHIPPDAVEQLQATGGRNEHTKGIDLSARRPIVPTT